MLAAGGALLAAGALAAPPAGAQDRPAESKLLWATVNICDTVEHPDTIGIRGAMPGSGVAAEQMFMRFELQYYDKQAKQWRSLGATGDSGFVPVGSGRFKQRQSGRNFTVRPPRNGAFVLRGAVTFEWRRGDEVVRRSRKRTTSGRGGTRGADPVGFSSANCNVRA